LRRYGHSRILGHMEPPFWRSGGCRGSAMAPFEKAIVVSYRLSIVICNHSAAICDRMSPTLKSTGVGHFEPKFPDVPLGVDPLMLGSAESEHPRLTNAENISEEFQPMGSQSTNVTDRRTDRRTDGRTDDMRSQDRALHCSASRGKNSRWQAAAILNVVKSPHFCKKSTNFDTFDKNLLRCRRF